MALKTVAQKRISTPLQSQKDSYERQHPVLPQIERKSIVMRINNQHNSFHFATCMRRLDTTTNKDNVFFNTIPAGLRPSFAVSLSSWLGIISFRLLRAIAMEGRLNIILFLSCHFVASSFHLFFSLYPFSSFDRQTKEMNPKVVWVFLRKVAGGFFAKSWLYIEQELR